jgi:hypothetical protein
MAAGGPGGHVSRTFVSTMVAVGLSQSLPARQIFVEREFRENTSSATNCAGSQVSEIQEASFPVTVPVVAFLEFRTIV